MKLNRIILPLMACALTWSSCDDQIMEWKNSDGSITASDIPLALKEKIANYDYIKSYVAQYAPNMNVGLGLGADLYINDAAYRTIADANFQMFTTGNAMKHSAVVKANGELNFTTIDAFLNLVPADIQIYGHNFLWHTQQKQTYLKSLIAPEVVVEVGDDDVCENIVGNYGFEGLEVPHAHIHLIPIQKESDMLFSNPKLKLSDEEFKSIAQAINSSL